MEKFKEKYDALSRKELWELIDKNDDFEFKDEYFSTDILCERKFGKKFPDLIQGMIIFLNLI